MSFKDDYEAALREEQRAKDAVNEARRAYKAAKERVAQLHGYAEEFEMKLNGNKPTSTDADQEAQPQEDAPPRSGNEGDGGSDRQTENVQN